MQIEMKNKLEHFLILFLKILLCCYQRTRRVAIEPMHDARPKFSGNVAELIEVKLQRARQRHGTACLHYIAPSAIKPTPGVPAA